jgi:hypothetical protein
MPFVIMFSAPHVFSLSLEGTIGTAGLAALRFELAAMLAARPQEIELRMLGPACIDGAGWGLLAAFFDVFWSRGGRLALIRGGNGPVLVQDLMHLKNLLGALVVSTSRPGPAASQN